MKKKEMMISLNEDLMTDLAIEGLEERLETDPLISRRAVYGWRYSNSRLFL